MTRMMKCPHCGKPLMRIKIRYFGWVWWCPESLAERNEKVSLRNGSPNVNEKEEA